MTFAPLGLTPLIGVFDMLKSLAFYRDILGFEIVSASPEVETAEGRFSHWMWLRFGSAELMLNTQYDSDERPAQVTMKQEVLSIAIPASILAALMLSSRMNSSANEASRLIPREWRRYAD